MTTREEISPEWQGILVPGERILWQGAPLSDEPYIEFSTVSTLGGIGLIVWFFFYVVTRLPQASSGGMVVLYIFVFLIFSAFTGYATFGRRIFHAYKVRHSFYTLTTRRAIIGWTFLGRRRLDDWPIRPVTKIELDPGYHGHVYFAEKVHKDEDSSWIEKIGFRNIPDAQDVYDLMRQVQEGTL